MISQFGSKHHHLSSAPPSSAHQRQLSSVRSVSSAAQRRAVPFPGVPWCAMPCGAVLLCDAVRCCYLKCHTTGTTAVSTRYCMLNHKKMLSQLSYSSAAQRRAVLYGAVPCPAVLCRAALCFLSNTAVPGIMRCPIPTGMYACTCVLVIFSLPLFDCLLSDR